MTQRSTHIDTLNNLKTGKYCSVKIEGEAYPAIYLKKLDKFRYLVYLFHTDSVYRAEDIYPYEYNELTNTYSKVMYGLLESPAYFLLGTSLYVKWGQAYSISTGELVDIDENELVDKIVSSIRR